MASEHGYVTDEAELLHLILEEQQAIRALLEEFAPVLRKFVNANGVKPSQIVRAVLANGARSRL